MAYPISISKTPKVSSQPQPRNIDPTPKHKGGGSWLKSLVSVILILAILGGGVYFFSGYSVISKFLPGSDLYTSEWQAVFLTNGQVYFGKILTVHSEIIVLTDIYYLQVVNVDSSAALGQPPDVQAQPEQRLTLIKLGNEIHGPTNRMLINIDHIIITEDLKSDSRVVQAINDHVKNQVTTQ